MVAVASGEEVIGNVAFSAVFHENTSAPGGQIVKYPVVYTNHGDGYNSETGVFTASHKGGLYVFHVHVQPQPGDDISFTLYHNDNPIVTASGKQQGDNVGTGSNSVTLRLKKNDRVYIKADYNSSIRGDSNSCYNSLTGYLIGLLTASEV
ncbi:unnamed protein product [Candidula unifasciata]|uniref:C1q domain-containing protein n=1 Tax=Candidula unifasciata TaxID=100452 RepID=A0A8S3YWM1_9EUPU|nr:unnamed protein product [Candidula unifasciata]